MTKRRNFIATGVSAGTSIALAALSTPSLAANNNVAMTRANYERYVDLFNVNDLRFLEYYHPDVVLELGASEVRTAQGIGEFYTEVKKYIKETVTINQYIADANGVAVEIPTTFECYADWDDSFWGRSIKAGEVMRIISFGFYQVEEGKFKHIKTARYKMINDWQQEG